MVQPLHIRGAHIWDGHTTVQRDLYTTDRIMNKPAPGALTVDLDGYTIFPGLINAHDHLELNHYPRSKFRDKYDNAHQWGEDMNARLDTEPYKSLRAYPLWDKLFIGGLKNLLCGATTVAHHNPPHKELWHKDFPVRVMRKYGWSHSLHFSTDEEIVRSYRSTPPDVPWFIHLAEGTDDVAAGEYQRLKALGCVGKNTVIVHGLGMSLDDVQDAIQNVRGLVWCPSTYKHNLIRETKDANWMENDDWLWKIKPGWANKFMYMWRRECLLALGSDSRLTADGDLLDELSYAARIEAGFGTRHHQHFIHMVTEFAGKIIGCKSAGHLLNEANADFLAIRINSLDDIEDDLDPDNSGHDFILFETEHYVEAYLCHSRRADLALVVKGGIPQIGDPDVMAKFPHIKTVPATLDGKPKLIQSDLAERINKCKLKESGLEVEALPKRMFRLW